MKRKQKDCAVCGEPFTPFQSTQRTCTNNGYECAKEWGWRQAEKKRAKEWNKETRRRKEAIKTKAQWAKEAQAAFNKFIRLRDANEPCISCQRHHKGQYHAGHYKSVGAHPELRFEELNNNKQCAPCNNHLSGNIVNYRIRLIEKIGIDKVEWLEGDHEAKRYTIDDLKEIKAKYNKLARELDKHN